MSKPAKNGAIIYSNDVNKLSRFYIEMFNMKIIRETEQFISIEKEGFNVVIHNPPSEFPNARCNSVKLFLTVESLNQAKELAVKMGGQAYEGVWSNPIFSVCNISDPEGNDIQLREFTL